MKNIGLLFILLCYFCEDILSTGYTDGLTGAGIMQYYRNQSATVRNFGIVQIRISTNRTEQKSQSSWDLPILFSDGTTKHLNLKLTEKHLINNDIPTWYARLANNSHDIHYENVSILKDLGEFDLYHDVEQRAAIVVFYQHQLIEGYMQDYQLKYVADGSQGAESVQRKYLLLPVPIFDDSVILDMWLSRRSKRRSTPTTRLPPAIVYPQLLIHFDYHNVQVDELKALRQMIAYWNAVDMLYSDFVEPRIKITLSGFILPKDDFSTRWLDYLHTDTVLQSLGNHFYRYSHMFPGHDHDVMFSFFRSGLRGGLLGIVPGYLNCSEKTNRIGLLHNNMADYSTGAHELAHLFGATHDDSIQRCKPPGIMGSSPDTTNRTFHWTDCTRESIRIFFRGNHSQCLYNCPRTKRDCPNVISHNISASNDVTSICLRRPGAFCAEALYQDAGDFHRFDIGNITCHSRAIQCNTWYRLTPLDGTICTWSNDSKPIEACYQGQRRPIDSTTPICAA